MNSISITPITKQSEDTPDRPSVVPDKIIPTPSGGITVTESAEIIFRLAAEKRRMFMRGDAVHEVARGDADILKPVSPSRLVSMVETLGARVAVRVAKDDGKVVWRTTVFPKGSAEHVLLSDAAREHLPHIRQLCNCAVLTASGDVLGRGHHDFNGGTYVSKGYTPPDVPLEIAVSTLLDLLSDFNFASPADASRAMASLISPAMKMGRHITDDFPLDLAEADQSQSGKTYRQRLVAAIYGEEPATITPAKGGVGGLDESIASALIAGRPFICLDNYRGKIDSPILETALRGHGKVRARGYRAQAEVDTGPFIWQLSTNGAELTRDLANRSIVTRIRKRDDDYKFRTFPEGDLIAHVKARQPIMLGCVVSVIREWMAQGCPTTDESRHDFRGWVCVMDWIVKNICGLPPLLDGHKEEQLRTANPKLQWLRDVINVIVANGYQGDSLTASDMGEAAEGAALPPPGRRPGSTDAVEMSIGRVFSNLFREAKAESIVVDGRRFVRHVSPSYNSITRTTRDEKTYTIETP